MGGMWRTSWTCTNSSTIMVGIWLIKIGLRVDQCSLNGRLKGINIKTSDIVG